MKPVISIIMSCFNEEVDLVKKSVESILKQTFNNFEFIIVIDNPKNILLKNYLTNLKIKDERLVLIENKFNLGLAESLNKAINIAKGKYMARMDADDIAKSDRLEMQFNYLEKNKNVDLLFSWVNIIDENDKFIRKFKPSKKKIINITKYYFKEHLLIHPTLFCKSIVLKNNLYDIKQKRSQDFELWLRLINKKYNFDIIEDYLLSYRISNKSNYITRINKVKLYNKYTLLALKKHNLSKFKGNFIFYLKTLFLNLILRLPIKLIIFLILIKDLVIQNKVK